MLKNPSFYKSHETACENCDTSDLPTKQYNTEAIIRTYTCSTNRVDKSLGAKRTAKRSVSTTALTDLFHIFLISRCYDYYYLSFPQMYFSVTSFLCPDELRQWNRHKVWDPKVRPALNSREIQEDFFSNRFETAEFSGFLKNSETTEN